MTVPIWKEWVDAKSNNDQLGTSQSYKMQLTEDCFCQDYTCLSVSQNNKQLNATFKIRMSWL